MSHALHDDSSGRRTPQQLPRTSLTPLPLLLLLLALLAAPTSRSTNQAAAAGASPSPISTSIDPASTHVQVPLSFLGLSHEPIQMAKSVVPTPQYRAFIHLLSSFETGPFVIRWGGNEQDKLLEVLDDEQWKSLQELHQYTGVRYMIGLNLKARDPQLALAQVTNAMRFLAPEAVLAFNIGNEADAFTYREDKETFPSDYWSNGWFQDVAAYSEALAPVLLQYFNTTRMISGPGSADMTQWRDPVAKRFCTKPPLNSFVTMLTAHYYTYRSTSPGASHTTFLAESKLEVVHRRVGPWVRWARANHLHFRLEETNSLAIAGLAGASDTLAACLFYVDYALTMIKAGVSGMNFHDSSCSAYSAIVFPSLCLPEQASRGSCADICGKEGVPPLLRAPYYGLLFIQMALAKLPKLLGGIEVKKERGAPNVKVHALNSGNGEELRIILVKKDGETAVDVSVEVKGTYGLGSLSLLTGPSITSFVGDITVAGQQVNELGELYGERVVQEVQVQNTEGVSRYTVSLPAASAAMLIVRPFVE